MEFKSTTTNPTATTNTSTRSDSISPTSSAAVSASTLISSTHPRPSRSGGSTYSSSEYDCPLEPTNRMLVSRPAQIPRLDNTRPQNQYSRPSICFENLKSERARLETFYGQLPHWNVPFIKPQCCASAGFFFLRDGDKVQCAFCRGVAGEWEVGDVPLTEHKRHFPRCPFICNLPVGNIPIGQEVENTMQLGYDVCGPFEAFPSCSSTSNDPVHVRGAQPINTRSDDVSSLAIRTGSGPARKNLVTLDSRIKTFSNWPLTQQPPERMAEAGFYYIGTKDHVKCFYCDGGLKNWEDGDDAWAEHARWFANCPYVVLNKGKDYIRQVSVEHPALVTSESLKNSGGNSSRRTEPRRVTDDELRLLIDTPIVQAALEMGMELNKVKSALQRKLQQTGTPFLTTEALLEAILGSDPEYDSDSDSSDDNDEDDDLVMAAAPPCSAAAAIVARATALGGIKEEVVGEPSTPRPPQGGRRTFSESGIDSSSGDEDVSASVVKALAARTSSDESGTGSVSSNSEDEIEPQMKDVKKALEMKEEEIRKLREARQCKICMDNEVGVVFLPCGHLVSCVSCATALSNCALCRQPIKAVVRTYLS